MATKQTYKSGFTIVELLIVIVVIGILAAITIVAYNGVQNRAYDVTVQSDLSKAGERIEIYKIEPENGSYPYSTNAATLRAQLATANIKVTESAYNTTSINANLVYFENNGGSDFVLIAQSKSGKNFYYTSMARKVQAYPHTTGQGVFPAGGLTGLRPTNFSPVENQGAGVWGFGSTGWAPEWINQ